MDNAELYDDRFTPARREESKAHNEMDYYKRLATGQQTQMGALLLHKDECVKGIARAKKTGLPPTHVREFKLLMAHIDQTIETLSYKVDKSQVDYEKAEEIWVEKRKILDDIKEEIRQKALEQESEFADFNEEREKNESRDVFKHKAIKSAEG